MTIAFRLLVILAVMATCESACGSSTTRSSGKQAVRAVILGRPLPVVETYHGCPPQGSGGEDPFLNQLKNRVDRPAHSAVFSFRDVESLDWPAGVVDVLTAKWQPAARARVFRYEGRAATFVGYLTDADVAGAEPTNCVGRGGLDWHLWLGTYPHASHIHTFVAEITPRMRARYGNFDLSRLESIVAQGNRVRVTGWLMFDSEHIEKSNRRTTVWEMHPFTFIDMWNYGHWVRVSG
ncbi:MAG: hypothetical protein NVS4B2_29780 [Chloroflexota bacterium]